ncbi:MAG: MCE family protein [Aquimonas sp.]|jgi:phospholipid/cholesterol/gamma-HCH transport system substrate-binding protein|nr:MCE family protein [Xanthomonadales bacterium]MCC6504690.1 MCE family protein [Aquimonas sp.]
MKRDAINYTLVGLAVVVAVAVLLASLFAITGRGTNVREYTVRYANVTGLNAGAPVYYEGFRIGQVRDIQPEREAGKTRYQVNLAVRDDWPIPSDSEARLQSSGLLADVVVAIHEGRSDVLVADGGELRGVEGGDLFLALNGLAQEVNSLTQTKIRPLIDTLAERIESIGGAIDASAPTLLSEAQALLGRLNSAADRVNHVLDTPNQQAIRDTLANVRTLSADLAATQQRADALLDSLKDAVDENRPELRQAVQDLELTLGVIAGRIDSITHHLENSSRNMDEFTREIRRHPNRLIVSPPADDVEAQ